MTLNQTTGLFLYVRWVLGILFVFLFGGYPVTTIIYPNKESLTSLERIMLSAGFGLFLTYPSGFLNIVLFEGKQNIYQPHLVGVMFFLILFSIAFCVITYFIRKNRLISFIETDILQLSGNVLNNYIINRKTLLLLLILVISIFFNFYHLDRADVYYENNLGYRAYDLVDGIFAGRNAYCLSFSAHSPLAYYINHVTMQILNPLGFYQLKDWMLRFAGALIGVLSVLCVYLFGRELFNEKVGLVSAFIMAVSNYPVWMSRLAFLSDSYITFFMIISVYFFYKFINENRKQDMYMAGIFLSATMLVKFVGIILIPVYFVYSIFKNKKIFDLSTFKMFFLSFVVFMPVIVFNIGAYLTTGYMDVPFTKIARIIGIDVKGVMPASEIYGAGEIFKITNLLHVIDLLLDQYGIPLFTFFVFAVTVSVIYFKESKHKDKISLLWIWALIIILFFWANGTRAYYMPFITVPFAILTAYSIYEVFSKNLRENRLYFTLIVLIIVLGAIACYSMYYTYNTNISSKCPFYLIEDYARTGTPFLTIDAIDYHFSRSARSFSENYGYKELNQYVENNFKEGDLFVIDDRINQFALRWYLDINNSLRAHYLKDKYKPKYEYVWLSNVKNTNTNLEKYKKIMVVTLEKRNDLKNYVLAEIIYDSRSYPTFYIYESNW